MAPFRSTIWPPPVPENTIRTVAVVGAAGVKLAVTFVWPTATVSGQPGVVPLHAPPQVPKVKPLPGAAVSVTPVPGAKSAEQVGGHEIPPGWLVTVPPPPLPIATVTVPTGR